MMNRERKELSNIPAYIIGAIFLAIIMFALYALIFDGAIKTSEQYEIQKARADKGSSRAACRRLGNYHLASGENEQAFKYFKCATNIEKFYRNGTMTRLTGHYFYGKGVETDYAKGAMYLILSHGNDWGYQRQKRSVINPYLEIANIEGIDQEFVKGATLAKEYIKENNVMSPEINDQIIDSRLKDQLKNLEQARSGAWILRILGLLLLILAPGAILALIMIWSSSRRRQLYINNSIH